jgi:hypothetical protein
MRGLVATLLVALAAATPLACGAGEEVKSMVSPEPVAAAATKTAALSSFRASFDATVEVEGQSVRTTGDGVFDGKGKRGRITLSSSAQGTAFEMSMVMDWPVVFMRFPPELATRLPAGKPWVRFNMETLGKTLGFDFQQLMQASQADPGQGLGYLRGITDLETVGEEEVRGVQTTHYSGVVDLRQAAEELPEARESIDRIADLTGIERVPTEVWIDEDGLVRRMRFLYDNMRIGTGVVGDMTMVTELYDFGASADISLPPDDQVVDLTDLLGQS